MARKSLRPGRSPGHIAELLDELLPDREANDAIFRLTLR